MNHQINKLLPAISIVAFAWCLISFADIARAEETAAATTTTPTAETITSTESVTPLDTTTSTAETVTSTESEALLGEEVEQRVSIAFNLRLNTNSVFSNTILLPTTTVVTDSAGTMYTITSTNVLTALAAADIASDTFTVSQLQYFADWDSFYVKCITVTIPTTTEACDNWNYIVNGSYPSIGMDKYGLAGGETVYVYFNTPWSITASTNTFPTGATTTLHTWRYNYSDTSTEWVADPHNLIEISIPNPAPTGWWDTAIPVTTTVSNDQGQAEYAFTTTGTYYAKIISADFSKWSWPITLTVIEAALTITVEQPTLTTGGGGGNFSISSVSPTLDINKAYTFLRQQQQPDGSFGNNLLTDWSALAFAATTTFADTVDRLRIYLANNASYGTLLTDHERRTMALMSLGVTPYTGVTNTIQKIVDSFDGEQFGDNALVNDDIFALIPLLKAGYSARDTVVSTTIGFIVQNQAANGSWVNSVDVTAAAIQALMPARSFAAVSTTLDKAIEYLKNQQQNDGGFGNVFSTSWALQALHALDEDPDAWKKNSFTPHNALYQSQGADGGLDKDNPDINSRIWATAYAIPAALGFSWHDLMSSFSAPAATIASTSGIGPGASESTPATTTIPAYEIAAIVAITVDDTIASSTIPDNTAVGITHTELELIAPTIEKPVSKKHTITYARTGTLALVSDSDATVPAASTSSNEQPVASSTPASLDQTINSNPPSRKTAKTLFVAASVSALIVLATLGWRSLKKAV